jgi:DNA-binding CsgD family transcriptional regulator
MAGTLNAREIEILRLVTQGLSNRAIAKALDLAPKTIEHLLGTSDPHRAIYPKIGVTQRTEAAAWYTATFGNVAVHDQTIAKLHEQLVEVYADYQQRVMQLRYSGQPQLAISMADFLIQKSSEAAEQTHSASYRQRFFQLTAQALIEQCTAHLEIAPRRKVVQFVKPLTTHLKRIAKAIGDRHCVALANVVLAGAHNIQRHYDVGRTLYLEAYEQTSDVDVKLRILRGVTIAATYLGDPTGVSEVLPIAKRLIEEGNFTKLEQVCETCEGIGRGQGLLGLPEAFTWFETTEQILHSLHHPPLRTIQLLVSKQEVIMHMEPTALSEIENLGTQALVLAERYGYARHKETVLENLRKALDS